MNTHKLYRIFASGVLVLAIIAIALYRIEQHLARPQEVTAPRPPETSPLSEVEFESGALALRLKTEQEKRLNTYRGNLDQDSTVEVPIDRAIEAYLEGMR